VLIYGTYQLLDENNPDVYAYTRTLNGTTFLILLNFSRTDATFSLGIDWTGAGHIISNYFLPNSSDALRPYEAAVYQL
jgi:oligo-1,6-glucosidase